jgi:serine/threonine protein phosphatase PrpC
MKDTSHRIAALDIEDYYDGPMSGFLTTQGGERYRFWTLALSDSGNDRLFALCRAPAGVPRPEGEEDPRGAEFLAYGGDINDSTPWIAVGPALRRKLEARAIDAKADRLHDWMPLLEEIASGSKLMWGAAIESAGRGEDTFAVRDVGGRMLIVVADGAGGTGSGAIAAQMACDAAVVTFEGAEGGDLDWARRVREIDEGLVSAGHGGQSTLVVVQIDGDRITGASVGDSGAWLVRERDIEDLTVGQAIKPLLGSGDARPMSIASTRMDGRLVVASDGLFKYAPRAEIANAALTNYTPQDAATELVGRARMKNGGLQDDVAVVVCLRTLTFADAGPR